jgi:ACS family hexuronate transporter-like MFS transporter
MNTNPPKNNIGNYRWIIATLLFVATTINYIDRQSIGLLKPVLEKYFNWSEKDYGYIVMAFQASYALGLLAFGRWVDRIGARLGYTISVILWSIAAVSHALARTAWGFAAARAGLGLGESGNFPAAIRAVAEWFPKKERAFATGFFNAGTNIGAVVAPLMVPWILSTMGWQEVFIVTGLLGLFWVIPWWFMYDTPATHKKISAAELAYIQSDPDEKHDDDGVKPSWKSLFRYRQTWAFLLGKFLTDPIWWFFLLWLPDYFSGTFNLDLKKPGWPLVIVYTATSIGSLGGGYLSSWLIVRGWPIYKARKITMLIVAICVVPIVFAQFASNMWIVVALISLAAGAHQAWSANIFTTASDMFPKKALSSVVGIGGMAGSVGGMLFPLLVGNILEYSKQAGNKTAGYNIIFIICGFAYLLAWLIMHRLAPKMERVIL